MKKNEISAFASPQIYAPDMSCMDKGEQGLTKREYAAIQFTSALMHILAQGGSGWDNIPLAAIRMADNLFNALAKAPEV